MVKSWHYTFQLVDFFHKQVIVGYPLCKKVVVKYLGKYSKVDEGSFFSTLLLSSPVASTFWKNVSS